MVNITSYFCNSVSLLLTCFFSEHVTLWEEKSAPPFDELIVSWDAKRPEQGFFLIQVSLLLEEWSPWFDYAYWGVDDQYTFSQKLPEMGLHIYQDTIEVTDKKATGFKVRVVPIKNSSLDQFRTLHATTIDNSTHDISRTVTTEESVELDLKGLSQMALNAADATRLCSPTSTTAVIRYLSGRDEPSPCVFASAVLDSTFDIFGNWILNTAEASHLLGPSWHCFVAHLTSFDQITAQLQKGFPVVVSIKGPIYGSASSYGEGHLLVVKGYDAIAKRVLCMDPAFPTNEETSVSYSLEDFLTAWKRRKGIAYLFDNVTFCPEHLQAK